MTSRLARRRGTGWTVAAVTAALAAAALVVSPASAATVDTGAYYQLVSRSNGQAVSAPGGSIANGTQLVAAAVDGTSTSQQVRFVDAGGGWYRISIRSSGKVLDVAARSTADGAKVVQYTDNNAANQQFRLADSADGHVRLINRTSAKPIEFRADPATGAVVLSQSTDSGAAAQQWRLVQVSMPGTAPTIRLISPYNTPTDGWTVRGTLAFAVDARDTAGVARVDFYVDNQLVGTDTSYPYGVLWNTRPLTRATHSLRAVATNTGGAAASVSQSVTVAAPLADRATDGSVVSSGLLPNVKPVIANIRLRDVSVTRGADNAYYLTGTGSDNDAWVHNEGINLWRSTNLRDWTYVGLVWSFERDGAPDERAWWTKSGKPYRSLWAPEFQYLNGNYYVVYSLATKGSKMLRSTTGRPEGPYVNVNPVGGNLFGNIDGSLFQDSDGAGYLCYESGNIFKLNAGWTGTTGAVTRINSGADEGCFLFKANGKYYLSAAKFMDNGRYSSYIGIADRVTGPYTNWHEAIPSGGHNSFFTDCAGNWWGTFFGNDRQAPFWQQPALVKISFNSDGTVRPASNQTTPNC